MHERRGSGTGSMIHDELGRGPARTADEDARQHPTGRPTGGTVGAAFEPLAMAMLDRAPARLEFWDGSAVGADGDVPTLLVRSPDALRRILWSPGELGVARAFVAGDIDIRGDLIDLVAALRPAGLRLAKVATGVPRMARIAKQLGLIWPRPPAPASEARPRGWRHSKRRDAQVISHHYDVGNAFYRLVLGESMTYSCARFVSPEDTLAVAQAAKHDLVCRKLGLHERPGVRLLDVGCGWGSMAIHAAHVYGAEVVGITLSREQAEEARVRVREAGVADRVEIRCQDYRDLHGEQFDAISSIGMFEHVGAAKIATYFATLHDALVPRGRLLNHAISSVGGSRLGRRGFMHRYVFPDGELIDVGDVVLAMESAGFEVRDVESLREHYSRTLRLWLASLEARWDEAVALVGAERARVWLLYMAASAVGFDDGGINIHQVLGVVPDASGGSGMASTRREWD